MKIMIFRLTFCLVIVITFAGLLKIKSIDGAVGCSYNHKNYTACTIMMYFDPTPCNGIYCQVGFQKRDKGICCPRASENETVDMIKAACKMNCNFSDSDFYDLSPYVPPSTASTKRVTPNVEVTISYLLTMAEMSSSTKKAVLYSRASSASSTTHDSTSVPTVYTTTEKATISNAANMIGSHKIYM